MTPTLFGRWQTRLLLLGTIGFFITFIFHLIHIHDWEKPYFLILGYVSFFGIFWDILYDYIQKFRWDHDWPGTFQLAAGIGEAIFILILKFIQIPLPGLKALDLGIFIWHYSLIWIAVYISSQTVMRIIFPRWRFRGGQWF